MASLFSQLFLKLTRRRSSRSLVHLKSAPLLYMNMMKFMNETASWRRLLYSVFSVSRSRAVHLSECQGLRLKTPGAQTSCAVQSWWLGLCGLGSGGVLLSAIPLGSVDKPSGSAGSLGSLQDNAGSLHHHELIKKAAAIAVDSSCVFVTQAALAAISLHKEYAEMVNELKCLLEEHAQFVGSPSQEDDFWQDIIRQRVEIDDKMQAMEDVNAVLLSAISVLERAAEAAYQADAELSAMMAGQHLQLVQSQLEAARKVSQKAQHELTGIQAEIIKGTGEGNGENVGKVGS